MQLDFTDLITWLISAAAVLAATFIGAKIIPFLKEKGLYAFTAQTVKAAVTYFLDGEGKAKFDWVFSRVEEKYGNWFDIETIKDAIQGAYVDMCVSLGKEPSPSKAEICDERE